MKRRRGICCVCQRSIQLRKDMTIGGHGDGRPRDPYNPAWCEGAGRFAVYDVGDLLASTLNDTVCEVVAIMAMKEDPLGQGVLQVLTVRKVSGERGWAKVGETYPESNRLAYLAEKSSSRDA